VETSTDYLECPATEKVAKGLGGLISDDSYETGFYGKALPVQALIAPVLTMQESGPLPEMTL
jgi:hypothetical protein